LVHRQHSIIPDFYTPPGEAEWLSLYAQYPMLSVNRFEQAVTFDCPVVKATPSQEAFWAKCMPARARPDGLWFGWEVEVRSPLSSRCRVIRGRLVVDGKIAIEGKAHRLAHITRQDIETVKAHLVQFVDRLELVLRLRAPSHAAESPP